MIEVTLYTRQDCHLCEQTKQMLLELKQEIPLEIKEIDIDLDPALQKKYFSEVPVVYVDPYTIKAPIEKKDLEITLRAAQQRAQQIADIEEGIASGRIQVDIPWTRMDRFTLWLTRRWLRVFNIFTLIYVGLPFLAPVFMQAGLDAPAGVIYRVYGIVCHQFAFRSWFIYGEQAFYPRQEANIPGVIPYQETSGLPGDDLWAARSFVGDKLSGFKVALCQRDIAIYLGILMFGMLFSLAGRKFIKIPWYIWILLGVMPIAVDGFSQLISQPPLNLIAYRESTPLLRTITGGLFGFVTAWYGYPIAEESMRDSRDYLMAKLKRIENRQPG